MDAVWKIITEIMNLVSELELSIKRIDGKWQICITVDPKDIGKQENK